MGDLTTAEVESFPHGPYESDPPSRQLVNQAILVLERNGPAEGQPLVDTITALRIANMKELRPVGRAGYRPEGWKRPWSGGWWPAANARGAEAATRPGEGVS